MALNKVPYVDGVTVITAENLNDIQDAIIALENAPAQGLTEDMKQALLQIARKVAYIDDQGQTYYDDLYDAFYPPKTVVLITAVFEQGSTVIYDDTALDDLKQYLTVTAKYDDNTTAILADSAYTLSGLLEAGTSTVTVAYNGLTTTFTVNVTARPTLSSISAVYTQSGTVYDTDSLDSLKADLVVTAHYSDSSTQTVPAADYTLSGTLTEGTSTITVSYGGKTATFNVTVSVGLDSIAYGTKTYRDIFITDNVLGWFGDFESDFEVKSEYTYLYPTEPHGSGYKLAPNASASPSVSTSEYNSPGHSIDVSSSGATKYMSAYTNGNVAFGEDYIFAFACKVPSYSAGKVELQAFGNTSTVIRAIQAAETNGWTPVLVIGAPVEGSTSGLLNFNFGALGNTTYGNPNFTAYMDDLVCTPLPDGMTQEQALTAFAKYLEIRRNA